MDGADGHGCFERVYHKEHSEAFGRNQSGETASKNDFMEKAGFLTAKKATAIPTQRPEFLKNVRRPRKKSGFAVQRAQRGNGISVAMRLESIDLPEPGGRMISILCRFLLDDRGLCGA